MDRAHRIGQKKTVVVYRLITRNTVEEKIMGLQKFKLSIANSLVSSDNASMSTMDTHQLLDMFNFEYGKFKLIKISFFVLANPLARKNKSRKMESPSRLSRWLTSSENFGIAKHTNPSTK